MAGVRETGGVRYRLVSVNDSQSVRAECAIDGQLFTVELWESVRLTAPNGKSWRVVGDEIRRRGNRVFLTLVDVVDGRREVVELEEVFRRLGDGWDIYDGARRPILAGGQ